MKIYASLAVLASFITISFSFTTVNYPLLVGGLVVSLLVFLALRHVETNRSNLVDTMKLQASNQKELSEIVAALTSAVTNSLAKLEIEVVNSRVAQQSLLQEILAAHQLIGNQFTESNKSLKEQKQLLEEKADLAAEQIKQLITVGDRNLVEVKHSGKQVLNGVENIGKSFQDFADKYEREGVRMHEQRLEQQRQLNQELSNNIEQQAVTYRQLIDQLMQITAEMSGSKEVVREQILRMQETYVKELENRVRA